MDTTELDLEKWRPPLFSQHQDALEQHVSQLFNEFSLQHVVEACTDEQETDFLACDHRIANTSPSQHTQRRKDKKRCGFLKQQTAAQCHVSRVWLSATNFLFCDCAKLDAVRPQHSALVGHWRSCSSGGVRPFPRRLLALSFFLSGTSGHHCRSRGRAIGKTLWRRAVARLLPPSSFHCCTVGGACTQALAKALHALVV